MEGREDKYVPDMLSMSTEEQAGVALANKTLAERRIKKNQNLTYKCAF